MKLYLLDTHAIIWHEMGDAKLSAAAADVYAEAAAGRARLVLHPIVLGELYYMLKKSGQAPLYRSVLRRILSSPAYRYEPITVEDAARLPDFDEISEMHDRLIAIVANRLGATVVTRDPSIRASPKVRCLW